MVAKKSFFERLTGATKEEAEAENEKNLLAKVAFEEPKKTSGSKTIKTKKSPEPTEKLEASKPENQEKEKKKEKEKEKEKWPPEEEGQLTIDVYQTESDIVIKSTIAGVKSEDIDVTIANDMITIKGLRRQDESMPQENYYYQELYWGPFSRSVILPIDVDTDKVRASMKNGILTIKLPKVEKAKTKIIKVREIE